MITVTHTEKMEQELTDMMAKYPSSELVFEVDGVLTLEDLTGDIREGKKGNLYVTGLEADRLLVNDNIEGVNLYSRHKHKVMEKQSAKDNYISLASIDKYTALERIVDGFRWDDIILVSTVKEVTRDGDVLTPKGGF